MPIMIGDHNVSISSATAYRRDLVYLGLVDDALAEREMPHTLFAAREGDTWSQCGPATGWYCNGMTVVTHPTERLIGLSEDGDVHTYGAGAAGIEVLDPRPTVITYVTTVAGRALAVGMGRQAYLREDEGSWRPMHASEPDEAPSGKRRRGSGADNVSGFSGACGFSLDEIYAVGWDGEIWKYDGTAWRLVSRPTVFILTAATTHDDGTVHACGMNGTLVVGRHDEWTIVHSRQTYEDLWSIASFQGRVFAAGLTGVYEIGAERIERVDLDQTGARTFGKLTTADGVLWSVGADDVLAFDGTTWTAVL